MTPKTDRPPIVVPATVPVDLCLGVDLSSKLPSVGLSSPLLAKILHVDKIYKFKPKQKLKYLPQLIVT